MSRLSLDSAANVLCMDCGSDSMEDYGVEVRMGIICIALRCRYCRYHFSVVVVERDKKVSFTCVPKVN